MQEVHYTDGRITREFIQEIAPDGVVPFEEHFKSQRQRLAEEYAKAMNQPCVKEIRQVLDIGRNDRCPCGSGKKFKRCCIAVVNQGVRIVEDEEKTA